MPSLVYADFDYYTQNGQAEAIQDIAAPLVGTGSLIVRRASGSGNTALNFAPKTPTYSQGVTRGRLRALFKQVTISSAFTQNYGLLCMQSQRDMTGTTGTCYAVRFRANLIELTKIGLGLQTAGAITTLAASGTIVPGTGINALQLEWAYLPELAGVGFFVYHGTQSNFSDLATVITYTDNTSPYTTTVTEGGYYNDSASGLDFNIRVDQMKLQGP